ncbi:Cytochrome b [Enhydrobacter aerosaccus]|uniref:Cytochrome b n=1 Tax=Enhydrobacter aerosaccus TaxID=225324 RepID=A0A1T4R4S0_9HYPH|nr:cytochrome b/b6 domain-containing protein [Enhydrobacter aerosaccus]SKA11042.1 Cytochrome b [Enhydrobacter aerosaccus]
MRQDSGARGAKGNESIRVWDLPVRLFHWGLVVLMTVSYFTGRAGGDWMKFHFWSGYAILTLLLFRICWGFVGSTTARFSDFIKGPAATLAHLGDLFRPGRPREVGHNPLGGLMVVVLLVAVLAQVAAGLFSADTDMGTVSGPLANLIADKWVDKATAFHHLWVKVLLVLVGLHVLAVFAYLVLKRQNLVRPMVTGRKPMDDTVAPGQAPPRISFASGRLAFSVLIACAAIVYFILRAGG